ncbi:MAG: hypothetical protein ACYTGC_02580 [Planctomycetota bacterium]|jgi:hypothetical protein
MRVELRDRDRRRIGRITLSRPLDPSQRPTRVQVDGGQREVFLRWDSALDDAGQLRRCIVCGCGDLFTEKAFPQVTAFVVVLAFAGAVVGFLGYATTPPVLVAMGLVLVLDLAILVFSRRRLVCYRCRSSYHALPIARYHRRWDRAVSDRYPAPAREIDGAPELGLLERDEVPL